MQIKWLYIFPFLLFFTVLFFSINSLPVAFAITTPIPMKVLQLMYFPLNPTNPSILDVNITGMSDSVATIRTAVQSNSTILLSKLTQGSTYHGYANSSATPSLQYSLVNTFEFDQRLPEGAFVN